MTIKRGRKSAAAQAVVVKGNFGQRPEPPADLTDRQAEIWKEITASEAADFFSTAAVRALLCEYCRRRDAAETISEIINTFKPEWLKAEEGARRYHSLLKMRDLESRGAISCATKLRLTNQARYTALSAATATKNASKGFRPWDMP